MVQKRNPKTFFCLTIVLFMLIAQFPLPSFAKINSFTTATQESSEHSAINYTSENENAISNVQNLQVQTLQDGLEPIELVRNIVGEGVEIQNVKFTGADAAAGIFTDSNKNLGLNSGIILSTGDANGIRINADENSNYGLPGDIDLEELVKNQNLPNDGEENPLDEQMENQGLVTKDAAVLEFDFKPVNNRVSFQYVMASDEYPEFLNYSDVFGFFVNGINIALIPDVNEPVSISNVNHEKNSQYYKSNREGMYQTEMDGMTTVLSAEAKVIPQEWNRIKLAIADYGDTWVDSNVMIKANSFDDRPVKPGEVSISKIKHTYSGKVMNMAANLTSQTENEDEMVTAEVELLRLNGTDGDISVVWNTLDEDGQLLDEGTVTFSDGESNKKIQVSFPKKQLGLYFKLISASGGAEINHSNANRLLTLKGLLVQPKWELNSGKKESLKVNAILTNDEFEDVTNRVVYQSSDNNIVSVSPTGEMTAGSKGQAIISITYMGIRIQSEVTVTANQPTLQQIEVSHESLVLKQGEGKVLQVTGHYSDGNKKNLTSTAIYGSSNESIVSVSPGGEIKGVKEGKASISVAAGGLPAITIPVDVIQEPLLQDISFKETDYHLETGQLLKLKVEAVYDNDHSSDITAEAAFEIIEGEENAVKFENGFVSITSPGIYKVKAVYQSKEAEVTITVKELTNISFDRESIELKENETVPIRVTAIYAFGEPVDITDKVQYISSNPEVAKMENGTLTAISEGAAAIHTSFNGKEASVQVTVKKVRQITAISFEHNEYQVIHDQEVPFNVTASYDNGETEDITLKSVYTISNTDSIKIENGKMKGLKPSQEKITIKAIYEGKEAEGTAVVAPYLSKLETELEQMELEQEDTTHLNIKAVYSDGSKQDIASEASYESDYPKVAMVTNTGEIQALAPGKANITANYKGKTVSFSILVRSKHVPVKTGFDLEVSDHKLGAVSKAMIMIQKPEQKDPEQAETNEQGQFLKEAEPGLYKIYVYKQGYLPVYEELEVESNKLKKLAIKLQKSELIKANFKADRMSIEQLMAAGIQVEDPENRFFYKFEAHLAFQGKPIDITYYGDNTGKLYNGKPWNIGGGYYLSPYLIPVDYKDSSLKVPMVAYMIIPGEVSWQKEFFRAQLAIENLAPPQFALKDSKISLKLPKGLSLANVKEGQSLEFTIDDINGGETFYHEWYIRGDEKGQFNLEAELTSKLHPFQAPVSAKFITSKPITVWGDDALEMHIRSERTATAGMPYELQLGIKNVSHDPLYFLNFELNEDGGLNYFYSPKTILSHTVEEIGPNEMVTLKFLLIPKISGALDVSKSFVLRRGGNSDIKTVITTLD